MTSIRLSRELSLHPAVNQVLFKANGKKVYLPLENQLMEILVLLVQRNGQVVTKEEFIAIIWEGNRQVGQTALSKNIFKLRTLLKENGIDEQLKIETIPKRGYRVIVQDAPLIESGRNSKNWIIALASALSCALGILLLTTEKRVDPELRVFDFEGVDSNYIIQLKRDGSINRIHLDSVEGQIIRLED